MVEAELCNTEDELRSIVRRLGSGDAAVRLEGLDDYGGFLKKCEEEIQQPIMKLWRGLFYGLWLTPGTKLQVQHISSQKFNITSVETDFSVPVKVPTA